MKSQIRSILFGVLVAACGGGDGGVPFDPTFYVPHPIAEPAIADPAPVAPKPVEPVQVQAKLPSTFDEAMAAGLAAAKSEPTRAREMFEIAIKLDAKRAEPHVELARLFISTGDRGMAVAAAKKAVKLAPLSSQAWNTKGRAELARFDYDAAIEAFTKSVELNHDNVWAWNNLGYTELQLKKYDDAVVHLTEATSRKGAEGYMWNNLGTALEQQDKLDDARHAFEQGAQLGSKEAVASRKRLEGVKTIAVANDEKPVDSKTYEVNEGPDEDAAPANDGEEPTGSDKPTM